MSKTTLKYHCLSATSESYGDYGPFLFVKRPSDKELLAFLQKECGDEMETASLDCSDTEVDANNERGVGWKGSNLLLNWTLVAPSQIPKQKMCVGYCVKDGILLEGGVRTGRLGYIRVFRDGGLGVERIRPKLLLSRAAAHRLLADWLECGELGTVVRVMR